MKVPSGRQMTEIDHTTIEEYNFPSILLMENAGRGIVDSIISDFPDIQKELITILIGPGNNGGDAFVIARQLHLKKIPSLCVLIGSPEKLKGDARINYELHLSLCLDKKGVPLFIVDTIDKWNDIKDVFLSAPFIIDGIFGTGLAGEVRGIFKDIIENVNKGYQGIILSIDVPSGLICDEGLQNKNIILADKTYTIGLPKLGMIDFPGKKYCGKTQIISIGFPEELLENDKINTNIFTKDDASLLKPQRKENSHKGDFGHTLIIAGSKKYQGAAHLTSLSAIRSGSGLVTLASIPKVCQSLKAKDNEVITISTKEEDFINKSIYSLIKDDLNKYSSAVIGPGIGTNAKTYDLLCELVNNFENPLVLDADALNLIAMNNLSLFKNAKSNIVLTPHIGEFSRLCGVNVEDIKSEKIRVAMDFAKKHNVILVLKDAVTIVTDGNELYYNSTGNCGLARSGSGDVLAGMIGAFISRNMNVLDAALFSVFLHGYVADIHVEEYGVEGITPTLLIENIYRGFLSI